MNVPAWQSLTPQQADRWERVLDTLADLLAGCTLVVVDSNERSAASTFADRLAATLHRQGRHTARLTDHNPLSDEDTWHTERTPTTLALADGNRWHARPPGTRWDAVIWLRSPNPNPNPNPDRGSGADRRKARPTAERETADIVIDLHDGSWPVLRHVNPALAARESWYLAESQAFFGVRAATWDMKFGDDIPAYTQAITESAIATGCTAIDVGCGTGRALPALRQAVGPTGQVIGIDATAEMLDAARNTGRSANAHLILADASHLPLRDGCATAVFAAGLLTHLPDVVAGLAELARITTDRGRLILFHPSGRATLAARHGRTLSPDEPLQEQRLTRLLAQTGWRLTSYDDAPDRFLAIAERLATARYPTDPRPAAASPAPLR